MSLQRQVRAILQRLPYILLAVVLAALPTFLFMSSRTKIYEAASTVFVGQALKGSDPDYLGLEVAQYLAGQYAWLAEQDSVLDPVIAQLGLSSTSIQLREAVTATVRDGSPVFTIAVRDADPTLAASITNAIVAELVAASPTYSNDDGNGVQADLDALRADITRSQAELDRLLALTDPTAADTADITRLSDHLLSLRSTYATLLGYSANSGTNRLTVIQPAPVPETWVAPDGTAFAPSADWLASARRSSSQ